MSHLRNGPVDILRPDRRSTRAVPLEPWQLFWAKTPKQERDAACHLLPYHNLDVAACAQELLAQDGLLRSRIAERLGMAEEVATRLVVWLLAFHDIGKFSGSFQQLAPSLRDAGAPPAPPYLVRHDTLGWFAWTWIVFPHLWVTALSGWGEAQTNQKRWKSGMGPLLDAVMGHHGQPVVKGHGHVNLSGGVLTWDGLRYFNDDERKALCGYAEAVTTLLASPVPVQVWDEGLKARTAQASWLVAGLAVLADWLGSNTDYFPMRADVVPLEDYWAEAQRRARHAVEVSGVVAPQVAPKTGMRALFPGIETPTTLQAFVEDEVACPLFEGPQLFIVEDATGSGKTETAGVLSHRLMAAGLGSGLYVGLPTMATADQMFKRVASWYRALYVEPDKASVVLAHSARDQSAAFRELRIADPAVDAEEQYGATDDGADRPGEAQCRAWLADRHKKALLASVGVGTLDQALLSVLPASHQSLRMLGLARNVLIVDEVHAYDEYVNGLLDGLLEAHAASGGSAILLSATLPRALRQRFCDAFRRGLGQPSVQVQEEGFPLVTHVGGGDDSRAALRETPLPSRPEQRRRLPVRFVHDVSDVEAHLLAVARAGGCACWVRNTVDDAVESACALRKKAEKDASVHLLHARFALGDRLRIQREMEARFDADSGMPDAAYERAGQILIATQVVEQSLDLDFDALVTDLAPIDLAIQRAGRMHRHVRYADGSPNRSSRDPREDARPEHPLVLFAPPLTHEPEASWYAACFDRARWVYPDHGRLWLTAQALHERGRLTVPDEARGLVEAVYGLASGARIPESLRKVTKRAESEGRKAGALAVYNQLKLSEGYGGDTGSWDREERAPTRLAEPTATLRLARLHDDGSLRPILDDGPDSWAQSEVRVRRSLVRHVTIPPNLAAAAEAARRSMPDKGRYADLVPLVPDAHGLLQAEGAGHRGPISITYDDRRGLRVAAHAA